MCVVGVFKVCGLGKGREMGFMVIGLGGVGEFAGDFLVLTAVGDWEEGWDGKGGIGFYMCLCCWWVVVGSRAE